MKLKFFVKIHEYENKKLVAICDSELIGKKLNHNGIELHVKEQFYGNMEYSEEEVILELKNSTSYNVFGKNICNLLIKHNMVHPDTVLWIEDGDELVGHAIVVR